MFLLVKKYIYQPKISRGSHRDFLFLLQNKRFVTLLRVFSTLFFVLYNFLLRAPRRPIQHCGLAISWCAVSSPSQRIFFYNAKSLKVHVVKQLFLLRRPVLQLFVCVWMHFEDAIYLYIIFAKKERGGKYVKKGLKVEVGFSVVHVRQFGTLHELRSWEPQQCASKLDPRTMAIA